MCSSSTLQIRVEIFKTKLLSGFPLKYRILVYQKSRLYAYELLRRTPGLRRKLAVSVKNHTSIPIPHSETEPQHVVTDSTLSLRVPCTENRNRTRNESLWLNRTKNEICIFVNVSNYLYFNNLGNFAVVVLNRFSIFLTFISIDINFRSTGKEIRSLPSS